ncbi:lysylphosphatidylglycerol synthase domain-containing protein [Agromyces sp. SYSU T00194]|uniref:lysylphosphatidylglycerol synthase domain-containing protein n=1 Tax=Agromyces chitinivorans TaxID=3158560 RepID=UPI003397C9D8
MTDPGPDLEPEPAEAPKRSSGRIRNLLVKAFPPVFYGLLLVFLAVYIVSVDWSVLEDITFQVWPLVVATIVSLGFRYWGIGIWFLLLRRLGGTDLRGHYRELSYIYAKSWLGRYIPGAATWILGKVYFASRHGVPRARLAVSGLLEGALQILATLIVGLALVLLDPRAASIEGWVRWSLVGLLVAGVIVLIPPVFSRLLQFAMRLLRRNPLAAEDLPGWRVIGEGVGLYAVGVLLTGVSYYLVVVAINPQTGVEDLLYIVGAASLASAVSMVAVFAPGGIGVREGTLALLLAAVMPSQIALVIVVVLRVWSVAVDLLFYVVAWAARPRSLRPGKEPADA